jgi:hypothetical protein
MEKLMRDLSLYMAGVLAIGVAIAHGLIAELRVFNTARIEPGRTRRLLRMVWQASTIDWIALGLLLAATPEFDSQTARRWVIAVAAAAFAYAAIGNAVATRGRHVGWILMCAVVVLTLLGI